MWAFWTDLVSLLKVTDMQDIHINTKKQRFIAIIKYGGIQTIVSWGHDSNYFEDVSVDFWSRES